MSIYDTRSVWLFSQTTNTAQRLLLLAIADGINSKEDHYRGKIAKLAHKMGGKTERYIQMRLNELVTLGELIIVERPKQSSLYYIPLYPGDYGYNPQPCDDKKHRCNGYHTSIDKDRETWEIEYAEQVKKQQQGRSGVHPSRVKRSSPQGEAEFTHEGEAEFTHEGEAEFTQNKEEEQRSKNKEKEPTRTRVTFSNQKQKTAEAERPRSMPVDGTLARLPDVTPLPDPIPPVAPPPLAPSEPAPKPAPNYGAEKFLYWQQVLAQLDNQYGAAFMRNYLEPCKLFERRPGSFVLVAPTPFAQEQINVRARDRVVMYLAVVARTHVELEVVNR